MQITRFLTIAALHCVVSTGLAQSWAQRTLLGSPPARNGASCAFDGARAQTVVFGGFNGGALADTWTFDGASWTQRTPATAPSPRWGHAAAHDSYRDRLVMFGGFRPGIGFSAETWEWDGTNWTLMSPTTSPPARGYYGLVYDRSRRKVVAFGGTVNGGAVVNDTWTYDGATWTQLATSVAPSPRRGVAMAYDEARERIVVFGGGDATTASSETWILGSSQTAWQLASGATAPSARWESSMCYDASQRAVVMVGGASLDYSTKFADVWHFTNNGWAQVLGGASSRNFAALTYDRSRARCVLFGGGGASAFLADTWERRALAVTEWTGATSTDPAVATNWSNGVPGLASTAVVGPTTRGCNGSIQCMDVVVRQGGSLGGSLSLSGDLDATGTAMTASVSIEPPIEAGTRSYYRCRSGAAIGNLRRSSLRASELPRVLLEAVPTLADWWFAGADACELRLRGNITVAVRITNWTTGSARIDSEDDASLTTPDLWTSATMFPPSNWNIARIRLDSTSSFTPTGGTVRISSGRTTEVIFQTGGILPNVVVEQGAQLRLGDTISTYVGGSLIQSMDVRGICEVTSAWRDIQVMGASVVTGHLRAVTGTSIGSLRMDGGLTVAPGGVLEVSNWCTASSSISVDGTVRVMPSAVMSSVTGYSGSPFSTGSPLAAPSLLEIRPSGTLRLDANATLAGFDVRVQGRIEGSGFELRELSDAGLQLLPGSTIGSGLLDLRGARVFCSRSGAGTRLVDIQRTEATVLSGWQLDLGQGFGTPSRNVRATTPYPVAMSNATGALAGSALEDDPLGVITWGQGVRYLGAGTPGCLPLAVLDGVGAPRIGSSGFSYVCDGAHPFGGGVLLVGSPASSPYVVLGLQAWIDLLQPVVSNYYASTAQGRIVAPQNIPLDPFLVGLTAAAQFALLEPAQCSPFGLSSSTAVSVTIQP